MATIQSTDRPLSFEQVGVIGADGAVHPQAGKQPLLASELRAADKSAPPETETFPASFAKVEPPKQADEQTLPEGFLDWPAYKAANGNARENFRFCIRYPGSIFTAGGRYHNAQNLEEVYDVEADQIVPDGLYLFPTNYLVNALDRAAILGGKRAPEAAPAQPNPLRSTKE